MQNDIIDNILIIIISIEFRNILKLNRPKFNPIKNKNNSFLLGIILINCLLIVRWII